MTITNINAMQAFQALRFGGWVVVGILLAKSRFENEIIGHYEQLMMIGTALSFFWISSWFTYLLREYKLAPDSVKAQTLFTIYLYYCINNIIFCILFIFFENYISQLFIGKSIAYLPLVACVYFANNFGYITEHIYVLHKQSERLFYYGLIMFLTQVGLVLMSIMIWHDIYALLCVLLVFGIAKAMWGFYELNKIRSILSNWRLYNISLSNILKSYWLITPLFITFFITGSNEFIDKSIISNFFDKNTYAQFAYGAKEFIIATIIAQALSTALLPVLCDNIEQGMYQLRVKSIQYTRWIFPLGIAMLFVTPYIFPLLFNKSFILSYQIANIYLLLLISRMTFPHTVLYALGKNNIVMISAVLEFAINISASLLLLPQWGIQGVAMGTVIAYSFDKLFEIGYLYFKLGINPSKYIAVREYVLWTIVLIIAFLVSIYL